MTKLSNKITVSLLLLRNGQPAFHRNSAILGELVKTQYELNCGYYSGLGQGNIFAPVCHSFHGGSTWAGTPFWIRYTPRPGTPPGQVHTAPSSDQVPWDQVHPPRTRYTPQPGTLLGPGSLPNQVHLPPEQCMLGDTGNKRAVRILLECILVVHTFET